MCVLFFWVFTKSWPNEECVRVWNRACSKEHEFCKSCVKIYFLGLTGDASATMSCMMTTDDKSRWNGHFDMLDVEQCLNNPQEVGLFHQQICAQFWQRTERLVWYICSLCATIADTLWTRFINTTRSIVVDVNVTDVQNANDLTILERHIMSVNKRCTRSCGKAFGPV